MREKIAVLYRDVADATAAGLDTDRREGMVNTMGGKVLKLQAEIWMEEGIEKGIEQGIEQGIAKGTEIEKINTDREKKRADEAERQLEEARKEIERLKAVAN